MRVLRLGSMSWTSTRACSPAQGPRPRSCGCRARFGHERRAGAPWPLCASSRKYVAPLGRWGPHDSWSTLVRASAAHAEPKRPSADSGPSSAQTPSGSQVHVHVDSKEWRRRWTRCCSGPRRHCASHVARQGGLGDHAECARSRKGAGRVLCNCGRCGHHTAPVARQACCIWAALAQRRASADDAAACSGSSAPSPVGIDRLGRAAFVVNDGGC